MENHFFCLIDKIIYSHSHGTDFLDFYTNLEIPNNKFNEHFHFILPFPKSSGREWVKENYPHLVDLIEERKKDEARTESSFSYDAPAYVPSWRRETAEISPPPPRRNRGGISAEVILDELSNDVPRPAPAPVQANQVEAQIDLQSIGREIQAMANNLQFSVPLPTQPIAEAAAEAIQPVRRRIARRPPSYYSNHAEDGQDCDF